MEWPRKLDISNERYYYDDAMFFSQDPVANISAVVHPNYNQGMHIHSFYEINVVLKGCGRHYIENYSMPVSRGNVFIIPPGISHGYWHEQGLDVFHLLIKKSFFKQFTLELGSLPGYSSLFEIDKKLPIIYEKTMFLKLSETQLEQLSSQLDLFIWAVWNPYEGRDVILTGNALSLIGRLCSFTGERRSKDDGLSRDVYASWISQCMDYIQQNIKDKLTAKNLSAQFNLSYSTFFRHFKKICHMTPLAYINKCRIQKAIMLLSGTNLSITEIAQQCGYFDSSHFTNCFVAHSGMAPLNYRKKLIKNHSGD